MRPGPEQKSDPIGWLIYRVMNYTEEQTQDGPIPMVQRASVLAQLYQAKLLQKLLVVMSGKDELTTAQFDEAIRSYHYFARDPAPLHEFMADPESENCYGCGMLAKDLCHQIHEALG